MKIPVTRPGLFLFHRIGLHIARPISSAVPFQRTSFAIRILRHALQGAQFHYSLVVLPGIPRVHHQAGQFRKGFFPFGRIDRSIYRKQARKHSEDIPGPRLDTAGSIQRKRWPPPYILLSLSKRSHPHSVQEISHRNVPIISFAAACRLRARL